jgi:FkbH-like protein
MKKCLVLDLDNTLWGGILGEDGMENLKLSLTPPGNSFVAFQRAILDLYERGIILAVNSRNNLDEAMEAIKSHPNMVLKEKHFAAFRINWNSKADNLKELALELNIGLDSMVFIDDDPSNRAMVKESLPEVEVPELPKDPAEYTKFLISLPYFESKVITDEDKFRGNYYVTERLRKEAEKSFENKEDFLKNLQTEIRVYVDDASAISRLSQLSEKTNQFNVFKQSLSEKEIAEYVASKDYKVFYAKVSDRFGDSGITAFALILVTKGKWHIKSFLLSCRVIGHGVEEAFLHSIYNQAQKDKIKKITISFEKTEKNKPAEDFVSKTFENYILNPKSIENPPSWIRINYEKI